MAECALYYPYIHIHDPEWLKAALLLFKQIKRMTPIAGPQPNDGPIAEYTIWRNEKEPLLFNANLFAPRVINAQCLLAKRLVSDAKHPDFAKQFKRESTEGITEPNGFGFQIHHEKLHDELKEALGGNGFAWDPRKNEPYDKRLQYVELHPRMGEVVMSTIAIACANADGLDIIGDRRSGPLHECLTQKRIDEVYDAWLKPASNLPDPKKPGAKELLEYFIFVACDIRELSAESLANLKEDRAPLQKLLKALSERANLMVAMDPGKSRTEQFNDEVSSIIAEWQSNRNNMSNYWKKFFGSGALDIAGKTIEKVVAKIAQGAPTAATASVGAMAGLALSGPTLAIGAGLGVGLITHGAKTYVDVRTKDLESPYRYLTLIEDAGVVIRTDLREPSAVAS